MQSAGILSTPVLKKAIDRYYKQLQDYKGRADYELAVRTAFLNLLNETAHQVKWMLIPEQTIEGGIRPDGVLRDSFDLKRGFWEAKGPKSDLDKEITKKIAAGYPLTNTIFENTKRAILFQNKKRTFEYDLHNPTEVGDLLSQFFTYTEPDIASFEVAVQEFVESRYVVPPFSVKVSKSRTGQDACILKLATRFMSKRQGKLIRREGEHVSE